MCKSHLQPLGGANISIFSTTPASKNNTSPWLESVCERERKHTSTYTSHDRKSSNSLHVCLFDASHFKTCLLASQTYHLSSFQRWNAPAPWGHWCRQSMRQNLGPKHLSVHRWLHIFLKQSKIIQFVIITQNIWLKPCSLTPTWFNKAFDDPKDIDYLLFSEDVVNFYSDDIVFAPQFDGFPTYGRIQTP